MKPTRPRVLIAALPLARACARRVTAALAAVTLAALVLAATGTGPAAANLLTNPGFETGALSGWICSAADQVTTSPAHSAPARWPGRPAPAMTPSARRPCWYGEGSFYADDLSLTGPAGSGGGGGAAAPLPPRRPGWR
jgi:hypothetical protein